VTPHTRQSRNATDAFAKNPEERRGQIVNKISSRDRVAVRQQGETNKAVAELPHKSTVEKLGLIDPRPI